MPEYRECSIQYKKPDLPLLRKSGYTLIDMHLHTCHSDGLTRIPDLIHHAKKYGTGIAITDHNEISGVIEAVSTHAELLIIPGIELETLEGPHLLIYFNSVRDLKDFFHSLNKERNRETPGLTRNLPVLKCLTLAEPYDCLRVAAHPFGYFGINRGVLKCVEKNMLSGVLDNIDGIEVICGGMIESLNKKAIDYARTHHIPYTGGSDAHITSDVGSVLTGVFADSPGEFLEGIRRRENIVIGKPSGIISKGATAGVIAWSCVPYTVSRLNAHYSLNKRRTIRLVSKCTEIFPYLDNKKKEK